VFETKCDGGELNEHEVRTMLLDAVLDYESPGDPRVVEVLMVEEQR
jgi:hypothetical protein